MKNVKKALARYRNSISKLTTPFRAEWNRRLTTLERQSLSLSPWQMFGPVKLTKFEG